MDDDQGRGRGVCLDRYHRQHQDLIENEFITWASRFIIIKVADKLLIRILQLSDKPEWSGTHPR